MPTCTFSKARSQLTEIGNKVAYSHKRVIVTRRGHKLFAIIPIEDLEALEAIESQIDLDDAKKALASVKKKGTVSWESIKRKLKLRPLHN